MDKSKTEYSDKSVSDGVKFCTKRLRLYMIPGQHTFSGWNNLNRRRVSISDYKNKEIIKKRRKILTGCKHKKSDKFEKKEGKKYEAGVHD